MSTHTHAHAAEHAADHACCHVEPGAAATATAPSHAAHAGHGGHSAHGAHGGHHHAGATWGAAASVTLHCLTGCLIGEWIGLAIGTSLGWPVAATMTLAITLAFVSGFGLTLLPLMRHGLTLRQAFKIVWLGEAVSIAAMELVMNVVDYQLGGMTSGMATPRFWLALGAGATAGYLAALPINLWLLRRNLKSCHGVGAQSPLASMG